MMINTCRLFFLSVNDRSSNPCFEFGGSRCFTFETTLTQTRIMLDCHKTISSSSSSCCFLSCMLLAMSD